MLKPDIFTLPETGHFHLALTDLLFHMSQQSDNVLFEQSENVLFCSEYNILLIKEDIWTKDLSQ